MATIFTNNVILGTTTIGSAASPGPYLSWVVDSTNKAVSTGPRIYAGTSTPDTVVTAPIGSLWIRSDSAGFFRNTDGATAWTAV